MKLIDFTKCFKDEASCENYLKNVREKEGLECSKCGCKKQYWNKSTKSWRCSKCGHETTLTSGTVMHGSKLPLMYWFLAMHLMTSTKKAISASEMQRQLGHKRYQPIWEMMHKLRSVMGARDEKYNKIGMFELAEYDFGMFGKSNRLEKSKRPTGNQPKAKLSVTVEIMDVPNSNTDKISCRCNHVKMKVINELKTDGIMEKTEESARQNITEESYSSSAHRSIDKVVEQSKSKVSSKSCASRVLPWVYIMIANAKSLFQDIYHGIKDDFLQLYLDEYCYKFNRKQFGESIFDRLVIDGVLAKSAFEHRTYRK